MTNRNRIRRCYKCGAKKYDDLILCEKCARELEERLKEKKKERENDKRGCNFDHTRVDDSVYAR